MKHSNLYLGLVLPSGGWQSLIDLSKHKLDRLSYKKFLSRSQRLFPNTNVGLNPWSQGWVYCCTTVPLKLFKPSLMFVGKAGAYPSEAHFRREATLRWYAWWILSARGNALAYSGRASLTEQTTRALWDRPGACTVKPFTAVTYRFL